MPEWLLPLSLAAAPVALLLLVLALRRPSGVPSDALALLAGKLEAVAGTQERLAALTADRLAQQDHALAERLDLSARRLDAALRAQNDRLAAQERAMADRLARSTQGITDSIAHALGKQNDRLAAANLALNQAIAAQNERLDAALAAQGERLARNLAESAQRAQDTAGQIQERLAVIDAARQNMEALGGQVNSLAAILGNKQQRGAFGEMQLRQLIEDRLPPDGFAWQHTLSNGTRCDCLIRLPYPPGPVAVDSKFPLEAWQGWRDAAEDVGARTAAGRQFSADMRRHVDDIARKYLIPGETAEAAILFVPSEAVFAELHTGFTAVVDEAQRRRVYIASPTTLWAMLSAMRSLMQDVRMRAQAGRIREEVARLMADLNRLNDRVGKLKSHFTQAQDDIRMIDISTDKILRTGARIESAEMDDAPPATPALPLPGEMAGG
ncbi:DNA recombination protein RmuC [Teichococcus oryzae]|uniref:DNA recombination protein RmuC homolog n=1 Tax=Teichococcus oryzae TaxID=1608942 RepID=A0A5B2TI06_9PROT|nr:DNA recombination protein RmuC [Pseudoroseomonas oryzae]KAA2213734.1 DNA recombination protein RmuC [Pseudoroseomonas oryzae]